MFANILKSRSFLWPFGMLAAMWGFFFLQMLGFFEQCDGAIIPRQPEGLKGIFFSPLLHGSLEHIAGNSVPIVVLMFLLFHFYQAAARRVFIIGWVLSGFLVWLLPPFDFFSDRASHICIIGASGIVYVLAFFLFFSGVFRRNRNLLVVSLLVALYYGGLIWGMLPEELFFKLDKPSQISWQSHLSGAVSGMVMAFAFRKIGEKKRKFIWEFPNYYSEKDDLLWQRYKETHPDDFLELPQKKHDEIWDRLDELRRKER